MINADADRGSTLIEMVTTLAIMSIAMAICTSGILEIYRLVNKTGSMATSQAQINITFLHLDKELRYTTGVSTPAVVGADWYVEYLTTASGTPICAELRLDVATAQLQHRTWTQGSTPLVPTAWMAMASQVSAAQPFTVLAPDTDAQYQRLRLTLSASDGANTTATTASTDITFTALNTSTGTSSATVCTEGRVIP